MTTLVVLSVVAIGLFIAGLAVYLYVVGGQLTRIASGLEDCSELVAQIRADAETIEPGVERINHTGGVIAGALPLLYGMAEGIVAGVTYEPVAKTAGSDASGSAGTGDAAAARAKPAATAPSRRSRLHDAVGYHPD